MKTRLVLEGRDNTELTFEYDTLDFDALVKVSAIDHEIDNDSYRSVVVTVAQLRNILKMFV